ncbi:MAG TPA: VWA domain-containing protein [Vicinamibacterales bacterium]|jgi:VWFA-related protein
MRVTVLALCGLACLQAQQGRTPTFKSTTELVEVDAIVLDRNGNFVRDLTPEQVTIYENGKPQQIQQFFMVTRDAATGDAAVPSEYSALAESGAHRIFVMMFDEAHLSNDALMRVKDGAAAFLRDMFAPGDAGGVFLNGGMYRGRLTVDRGELLGGIRAVQPAFENRQAIQAPFRQWPRINSEVEAMQIADGSREVVERLGQKACSDDPSACQSEGGIGNVENMIQQKGRLYVRQARMMTDRTLQGLERVASGLARIPGRKTVILMTEGFYVEESRSQLQMLAAQAARSGVTIYSIDGRGLINGMSVNPDVTMMERSRVTSFDTGEDGPTILTEGTGGLMIRKIDDITHAFAMIVKDTSTYYIIGYQPTNATMDGKVRKIEVKTSVPGTRVRARRSYAATKLPPQQAIWGFTK